MALQIAAERQMMMMTFITMCVNLTICLSIGKRIVVIEEEDDDSEIVATIEIEDVEELADELEAEVEKDSPLPDDEQAIYDATAADWMKTVLALIDRYDNAPHVKNALKSLGYTGIPQRASKNVPDPALKRLEMYRDLKVLAAMRDAEEG